ncbi:MAG TPA: M20 family metallopeptidase [Clostridia bacterium]|nr:M20 family metallopeptidase [Clostridia bacterium]
MNTSKQRIKNLVSQQEALNIVKDIVMIPSHQGYPKREKPVAEYLLKLFESEGIEAYLQEVYPGRPNVVAKIPGTGRGRSLMFNGHIDTVPPNGMDHPFDGMIKDGKLYGRGSADMKSGVGTMAYAMILLKRAGVKLKGDLIYIGVIDEDAAGSAGTRYIVKNGPLTDFAIVGEPTSLEPVIAHKGIDYFEVTFHGKSVHSSVPENGVNAILAAGEFISRVENELMPEYSAKIHHLCGAPTINVGLIQGSAKANAQYLLGKVETFAGIIPDVCKVFIDVRWTPDQTIEKVERDIRNIACKVESNREGISAETVYIPMPRPAMEIDADNELVRSIISNSKETLGKECRVKGEKYWGDSGLLYGISKIPTIMYGPGDIGCAHADIEWVETEQLAKAAEVYAMTAIDICGVEEE